MLETAVSSRSGFCVISGEIGAGKTTLIRELLNRLDETVCVGLVSNTHPSFGELLQWIMAAYGLSCGDSDESDLHKRFIEFAIQQFTQKKHTLLIIDEAQNLTVQALEELRKLSDVNTERDLVLQVILVGQQQLRDRLQQPELEPFSRIVALNYHLQALNQDETYRYIQHRVKHAGGQTELFSTDAGKAVYKLSGGIPRVINRLCDLSLVYGCTEQSKVITAELVDRVGEDQRMGTLLDIPRVDQDVTRPVQTEQSVKVPEQEKDESGVSSTASITSEAPARVVENPEPAAEADRLSSDTIVGAISPVLMPELEAAVKRKAGSAEKAVPSELHQLVVGAEQKKRTRGERGALWLLLAVIVMAGGTGWLMRDFQSVDPVVLSGDSKELPATAPAAAVAIEKSTTPVITGNSEGARSEAQDSQQPLVADSADPVKNSAGENSAGESASAQKAAEAEAAKQRAAELSRQAEDTARLKKESDRMERERRVAEQRLAKQRSARKELERKARLEREKMAVAKKEAAAQQRAAEQRLTKQRAATQELERKARMESEKMVAAKEAAKKLAEERALASSDSSGKTAKKPVPQARVQTGKAHAGLVEAEVAAYDEDDGDAIVQAVVLDAKASLASEDSPGVPASPVKSAATLAESDGDAIVQTDKGQVEFAANPCNGPTARFLSTCR